MLRELSVRNIALIESLEVEFARGLNILSGETGAGKSIIIDSLDFVLGGRADKSLIRYGEQEARVEAEFDNICTHTREKLIEYDIDCSEGLIISRVMSVEGRNVCRINGMKVTATALREITNTLVDIYGQHENSILLNPDNHIAILDSYDIAIDKAKSAYIAKYKELRDIDSRLRKYGKLSDVEQNMQRLEKAVEEIQKAKICVGEESELASKLELMSSSEEIAEALSDAREALFGDDRAIDSIAEAVNALSNVTQFDAEIKDCKVRLDDIAVEIEDITATLSKLRAKINFDTYEQERVSERLDTIRSLEYNYNTDEQGVIDKLVELKAEYDYYANSEYDVIELTKRRGTVLKELSAVANSLSKARSTAAKSFSAAVLKELGELGMNKTKFEVEIVSSGVDSATLSGVDAVEFMISPNPGQPLKPLSKIVSGGEMSRLMLAIKKITSEIDGVNVMVFDEIDTGISGRIADVVAKKLYDISKDKQLLAITHLPQLASMADNHYLIEKFSSDTSTQTRLVRLDGKGMVREIARLSGGEKTDNGIANAAQIKQLAQDYKGASKAN